MQTTRGLEQKDPSPPPSVVPRAPLSFENLSRVSREASTRNISSGRVFPAWMTGDARSISVPPPIHRRMKNARVHVVYAVIQMPNQPCVCVYDVAGVTILLSQTVFSLLVAHVLTRTSEAVPLIGTDPPFPAPSPSRLSRRRSVVAGSFLCAHLGYDGWYF